MTVYNAFMIIISFRQEITSKFVIYDLGSNDRIKG